MWTTTINIALLACLSVHAAPWPTAHCTEVVNYYEKNGCGCTENIDTTPTDLITSESLQHWLLKACTSEEDDPSTVFVKKTELETETQELRQLIENETERVDSLRQNQNQLFDLFTQFNQSIDLPDTTVDTLVALNGKLIDAQDEITELKNQVKTLQSTLNQLLGILGLPQALASADQGIHPHPIRLKRPLIISENPDSVDVTGVGLVVGKDIYRYNLDHAILMGEKIYANESLAINSLASTPPTLSGSLVGGHSVYLVRRIADRNKPGDVLRVSNQFTVIKCPVKRVVAKDIFRKQVVVHIRQV
jgi:hypothetical protein